MDYIVGLVFFIIILLIVYNFVTVTLITENGSSTEISLSLLPQMQQKPSLPTVSPTPVLSKDNTAINGKMSLGTQAEDYNRQFYLPPY